MKVLFLLLTGLLFLPGQTRYNYDGFQQCAGGSPCTFLNQYTKMLSNDMASFTQVNCTLGISTNAPNAIWHRGQWVMTVALASDDNAPTYSFLWNIYTAPYYAPGTCPTWTLITQVDWSSAISGVQWCFAPTATITTDNVLHWFVPCTTNPGGPDTGFTEYETHPTDNTLTAVTAPQAITITGKNNVIDLAVYQIGSTFWGYYKDENAKFVELATASTLTGTYTPVQTGDWLGIGAGFEGPELIYVGEVYRLYLEDYINFLMYWMDCTPVSSVNPSGIVSQYQFTEATGATLVDHVGANNCTPVASPPLTSTGWSFNRSTQWVDCGNPASLSFSGGDYSISGVFNEASSTFFQAIVNKGDGATNPGSEYDVLAAFNGAAQASTAKFIGTNSYRASESGTHSTGAWHTFAATSVGSVLTIYIDGMPLGSVTQAGTTNTTTNHVGIGASPGVANVGALFYDGTIAWMEFRNRGMSGLEVKQNHNSMANNVAGRGISLTLFDATLSSCDYGTKTLWSIGTFQPKGNTPGVARHGDVRRNPGLPAGIAR